MDRWIWAGVGAALALSIVLGVALHLTIDDLTGRGEAAHLRGHLRRGRRPPHLDDLLDAPPPRALKGELDERIQAALGQSALALAGVAFLAVAREGLETALFLISTTSADDGRNVLIGGLTGPRGRRRPGRAGVPRRPEDPDEALLPGDRRAADPLRRRPATGPCSSSRPRATWDGNDAAYDLTG